MKQIVYLKKCTYFHIELKIWDEISLGCYSCCTYDLECMTIATLRTKIAQTVPFYLQFSFFIAYFHLDIFIWFLMIWRLPFDFKTPMKYLVAIVIQSATVYNTAVMSICPVTFSIGTSFMFISLTKDIRRDLCSINESLKMQFNRSIITRQFVDFIRFHSDLIQLSDALNENCSYKTFCFSIM